MKHSISALTAFRSIPLILLIFVLAGCKEQASVQGPQTAQNISAIQVYKTPSCGCCGEWVDHIEKFGFSPSVVNQSSVADVKDAFGIPHNARSCHTAIYDERYVFEGHVPAKYMQQFLADPPEGAKGLLVPAMPLGSPGMEYQDQFNPYQILLLKDDGEIVVYEDVKSYQQQF